MTFFGLSEGVLRFGLFVGIFTLMAVLETLLPRRSRVFTRRQRWPANLGILVSSFAAVSLTTLVIPVTAVLTAIAAQSNGWGLFNLTLWPFWVEWLLAFLVLDFVIWGQHLVTHKVPILWRIHRVHHTDREFDATTAVRFHPVEIVLSVFVKSAAVLAIGADPLIVVLFEAAVNGSALFNHANLKLPLWLDRALRLVIVTPDMHRVHHSVIHRETDSNYGFALSWWDKLFRTYNAQPEAGHDQMQIGLSEWQDERPLGLGFALGLPFARDAKRKPGKSPDPVSKS